MNYNCMDYIGIHIHTYTHIFVYTLKNVWVKGSHITVDEMGKQ